MGFRADLLAAVEAEITALALTGTPTVGHWPGEEVAFNPAAQTPTVWVHLGPIRFGDDLEGGDAITYERIPTVLVYVCTADDAPRGTDGYTQGVTLLDELEVGLSGAALATGDATGPLTLSAEEPAPPHLGRYLWRQQYRFDDLVSR